MSPLTDVEKDQLDVLGDLLAGNFGNADPALLRTTLDGRDVAILVAVSQTDDGDYQMDPLAVLVNDELLARLTPPEA